MTCAHESEIGQKTKRCDSSAAMTAKQWVEYFDSFRYVLLPPGMPVRSGWACADHWRLFATESGDFENPGRSFPTLDDVVQFWRNQAQDALADDAFLGRLYRYAMNAPAGQIDALVEWLCLPRCKRTFWMDKNAGGLGFHEWVALAPPEVPRSITDVIGRKSQDAVALADDWLDVIRQRSRDPDGKLPRVVDIECQSREVLEVVKLSRLSLLPAATETADRRRL